MESGDGGAHSSPISLLMVFAAPSDNGGYEIFCVANAEDCQPTGQQFKGSETKSLSSRGGTCVPAHQQFGGAGREGAEGSIRHPCFKTWPSPSPQVGLHVETKPYFLTNVSDFAGPRAEIQLGSPRPLMSLSQNAAARSVERQFHFLLKTAVKTCALPNARCIPSLSNPFS